MRLEFVPFARSSTHSASVSPPQSPPPPFPPPLGRSLCAQLARSLMHARTHALTAADTASALRTKPPPTPRTRTLVASSCQTNLSVKLRSTAPSAAYSCCACAMKCECPSRHTRRSMSRPSLSACERPCSRNRANATWRPRYLKQHMAMNKYIECSCASSPRRVYHEASRVVAAPARPDSKSPRDCQSAASRAVVGRLRACGSAVRAPVIYNMAHEAQHTKCHVVDNLRHQSAAAKLKRLRSRGSGSAVRWHR